MAVVLLACAVGSITQGCCSRRGVSRGRLTQGLNKEALKDVVSSGCAGCTGATRGELARWLHWRGDAAATSWRMLAVTGVAAAVSRAARGH